MSLQSEAVPFSRIFNTLLNKPEEYHATWVFMPWEGVNRCVLMLLNVSAYYYIYVSSYYYIRVLILLHVS